MAQTLGSMQQGPATAEAEGSNLTPQLPPHLLEHILLRATSNGRNHQAVIQVTGVCQHWRAVGARLFGAGSGYWAAGSTPAVCHPAQLTTLCPSAHAPAGLWRCWVQRETLAWGITGRHTRFTLYQEPVTADKRATSAVQPGASSTGAAQPDAATAPVQPQAGSTVGSAALQPAALQAGRQGKFLLAAEQRGAGGFAFFMDRSCKGKPVAHLSANPLNTVYQLTAAAAAPGLTGADVLCQPPPMQCIGNSSTAAGSSSSSSIAETTYRDLATCSHCSSAGCSCLQTSSSSSSLGDSSTGDRSLQTYSNSSTASSSSSSSNSSSSSWARGCLQASTAPYDTAYRHMHLQHTVVDCLPLFQQLQQQQQQPQQQHQPHVAATSCWAATHSSSGTGSSGGLQPGTSGPVVLMTLQYKQHLRAMLLPRRMRVWLNTPVNTSLDTVGPTATAGPQLTSQVSSSAAGGVFSSSSSNSGSSSSGACAVTCACSHKQGAASCGIAAAAVPAVLCQHMENKRPQWNGALRTHFLNFNGRVKLSSTKNFQLVLRPLSDEHSIFTSGSSGGTSTTPEAAHSSSSSNSSSHNAHGHQPLPQPLLQGSPGAKGIVMQFGKTGRDTFILDYEPCVTTALGAFAVALTTFGPKLLV